MAEAEYRFFERQMAMYATYHRDWRNRLTHFFGVPLIIFALILAGSMWRFGVQAGGIEITFAVILLLATWVLWLAMDAAIGVPVAVLTVILLMIADAMAVALDTWVVWGVVAVTFVGGWAIQLWGHAYEGRKPALLDNLFQIFVAPMFLAGEAMIMVGMRRNLADNVERYAKETWPDYPVKL